MSRQPSRVNWGRRVLLALLAGLAIYALAGIPLDQWRALLSTSSSLEPTRVVMRAFDAITTPQRDAIIRVKVEKEDAIGLYPAVSGVRVLFRADGDLLGSARTNAEGVATFEWMPPSPGEFNISAVIDPDSSFKVEPESLLVGVYDPEDSFVVVGLDGTLAKPSGMKLPFEGSHALEPMRDAATVLSETSRTYHVLYLTGRDERTMHAVQAWLAAKGFPTGVSFFRDYEILSTNLEEYQYHEVQRLRSAFPHLAIGIGATAEDARAFVRSGLTAIMLGGAGHTDLPPGISPAATWEDVRHILLEH